MSYNDSYIRRIDQSVDDEYQRILVHQSSSIGLNMLTWLVFIFATATVWIVPTEDVITLSVALICIPSIALLVSYAWLRKHIPTPRVMHLVWQEKLLIALIIIVWIAGCARAYSGGSSGETLAGYVTGSLIGALCGLGIALFILKVVIPAIRNRDQRRLDDEFPDD